MTKYISTPSYTKEILEKFNLRAKKGFGQNFLVDPVLVRRCAEESHVEGSVIEIGPGIGSLTEQLALHSKHVTCYEIDLGLQEVLAYTLAPYDNVEIIFEDFLTTEFSSKVKALKEKYGTVSVCANLPYYITTPVLFKLFEETKIDYITVMVQKEVGERFVALPNTENYSLLSAEGQYLYNIKKLFNVPARSFNPSPNVDSVIIQFERKDNVDLSTVQDFFAFLKVIFKQRRKTITNNLKDYATLEKREKAFNTTGISGSMRAQSLSVEQLYSLWEALK